METLLAKAIGDNAQRSSLFKHLQLTYLAAKNLCDETLHTQLQALNLDLRQYGTRFRKLLLLAAATHDLGKANSLFQAALSEQSGFQSLRHEWVSYLLLRYTEFGALVKQAFPAETREEDFNLLVWVVACHHRKNEGEIVADEGESDMELLLDKPSFGVYFHWLEKETELFGESIFSNFDPGALSQTQLTPLNTTLGELLSRTGKVIRCEMSKLYRDDQSLFEDSCRKEISRFFAALRSSLIAADVAASAANDPQKGLDGNVDQQLTEWFRNRLGQKAPYEDIVKIVSVKENEIQEKTSPISVERAAFQKAASESDSRVTLCIAGCGSGKTLAAWKWAAENCPREGARVFFCYPTTGTATSGFVDYLLDPENKTKLGSLFHSRTLVDEEFIRKEFELQRSDLKNRLQTDAVMSSLKIWGAPIACCTVDVVLRFIVNEYAGILAWPALSQSIFIFDEVHSYDAKLFHWLLEFLKIVKGAKILLLSASLSEGRRELLRKAVEKKNGAERLNVVYGPKIWEEVKRYQRFVDPSEESDPIELALARFHQGEKILWVCNTVGRARKTIEELRRREPEVNSMTYHSRFRYVDRLERQKECVETFQKTEPAICVTTQVAEMSLDLSADFLISDLAPIPSLIQRLGRLNRRAVADSPRPFFIVTPLDEKGDLFLAPYTGEEFQNWEEHSLQWLDLLGTNPVSQADLAQLWNKTEPEANSAQKAPWLAASPWDAQEKHCLREASSTIQALLTQDVLPVKKGGRKKFTELAIPMARPKFEFHKDYWDKYGCFILREGRDITYDSLLGAEWMDPDSSSACTSTIANTIF